MAKLDMEKNGCLMKRDSHNITVFFMALTRIFAFVAPQKEDLNLKNCLLPIVSPLGGTVPQV
jgi:hypothetical protein